MRSELLLAANRGLMKENVLKKSARAFRYIKCIFSISIAMYIFILLCIVFFSMMK